MNIFGIDSDTKIAAELMVDKHVTKMNIEYPQLLSTTHRILDGEMYHGLTANNRKIKRWRHPDPIMEDELMKASHINHPSNIWVRESKSNYEWLYEHWMHLGDEYTRRYGRVHACVDRLGDMLKNPPKNIPDIGLTPLRVAMADQYIVSEDPKKFVENYRNYYNNGKVHLLRWTDRVPPSWIDGIVEENFDKKKNKTIYTVKKEDYV